MPLKKFHNKILELKKKRKAVILAHNYQLPEIQDTADYLGDSLELARLSRELKSDLIVFCGVKFMAETAKILSPGKKVLIPVLDAGCQLAGTITVPRLRELRIKYPDAKVVTYVNSSAEIKALSDVCCTSSNAVKVVKSIPGKRIIFVPDRNLGWWVSINVPEKEIISWEGYCYVHDQFKVSDLEESRKTHPLAEVIAHPECPRDILEKADYVTSTSGMLARAKASSNREFIIGTEQGMIYRLRKENPGKDFFSLGPCRVCEDMKKTTLADLYASLEEDRFEVNLNEEIRAKASRALEEMVKYC